MNATRDYPGPCDSVPGRSGPDVSSPPPPPPRAPRTRTHAHTPGRAGARRGLLVPCAGRRQWGGHMRREWGGGPSRDTPAPPLLGGPGPGKGAEPVGPAAPGPTVPTALGVWAAGTLGRGHGWARVCARPGGLGGRRHRLGSPSRFARVGRDRCLPRDGGPSGDLSMPGARGRAQGPRAATRSPSAPRPQVRPRRLGALPSPARQLERRAVPSGRVRGLR